jgi:hypothetical protein
MRVDLTKVSLTKKAPLHVGCQQEFRDELEPTRPAWEARTWMASLPTARAALSPDRHRHHVVAVKLLRTLSGCFYRSVMSRTAAITSSPSAVSLWDNATSTGNWVPSRRCPLSIRSLPIGR